MAPRAKRSRSNSAPAPTSAADPQESAVLVATSPPPTDLSVADAEALIRYVLPRLMQPALIALHALEPPVADDVLADAVARRVSDYSGMAGESEAEVAELKRNWLWAIQTAAGKEAVRDWWRRENDFPDELELLRRQLPEAMAAVLPTLADPGAMTIERLLPVAIARWQVWRQSAIAKEMIRVRAVDRETFHALENQMIAKEQRALRTWEGRQILFELWRGYSEAGASGAKCVYAGEGRLRIDTETICLDEVEQYVIESLVALRAAKKQELISHCGNGDAPRILKRIVTKHKRIAPFIRLPGKKGQGGYGTTIVAAPIAHL